MNGASHLLNRAGNYYFQRRVPDHIAKMFSEPHPKGHTELPPDLIAYFSGKRFIRLSLKTKNKREAAALCVEQDFKFNSYLSKVEQWIVSGTPVYDTVTPEIIKGIVQVWLRRELQDDEDRRHEGVSADAFWQEEEGFDEAEDDLRKALVVGNSEVRLPFVIKVADSLLDEFQISLDRSSQSYSLLHRELVKAFLHLSIAVSGRNRGEDIETPPSAPVGISKIGQALQQSSSQMTLDSLLEYWKGQAERKWKTTYDMQTAIDEFKALHGDLTIDRITKANVVAYKDQLLGIDVPDGAHKPRSPKTIEKRLTMLRALLQVAIDNDKLPFNPCQGVRLPKEKVTKKERVSFTEDDLKMIFSGSVHTGGKIPKAAAGPAGYWLPLLALYMGIREGEAAQITKEDVRREKGIDYVLVINEDADQQLKTESSKRRVPLHPDLISLGFIDFVETVPKGERLFPLVTKYRDQWAKAWGQWFGRYLRDAIGITDSRKVFHSFRHTFKDLCRAAGITEEVHDALTGHSNGGVGRMYGGENFPLEPLYEAIKKIRVGVKLEVSGDGY